MNHPFIALAFQAVESDNSAMWIILAVVLVILVFIVVIVGVGLTIFFIARKRRRAQQVGATPGANLSSGPSSRALPRQSQPEVPQVASAPESSSSLADAGALTPDASTPPDLEAPTEALSPDDSAEFDPSRTVAISRENTVAISYGSIKFVSGVLAGQQFDINPEGSYIGRESSLSQIVVSDPRISKRHLWIGVRDGLVKVVDQDSRNGTFLNDPRSERVTEATLNSGDTVIMGESDVARFQYHA